MRQIRLVYVSLGEVCWIGVGHIELGYVVLLPTSHTGEGTLFYHVATLQEAIRHANALSDGERVIETGVIYV